MRARLDVLLGWGCVAVSAFWFAAALGWDVLEPDPYWTATIAWLALAGTAFLDAKE